MGCGSDYFRARSLLGLVSAFEVITQEIRKVGQVLSLTTKADNHLKVDFGGHMMWITLETFSLMKIKPVIGGKYTFTLITRIEGVEGL